MADPNVKLDTTRNRTFNFTKDGVNLAFTLRTDISKELKAFIALLKAAIPVVEEELKRTKNGGEDVQEEAVQVG